MKLHPTKKGWVTGWLPWGRADSSDLRSAQQKQDLNEVGACASCWKVDSLLGEFCFNDVTPHKIGNPAK